jgi:hypothetical protein
MHYLWKRLTKSSSNNALQKRVKQQNPHKTNTGADESTQRTSKLAITVIIKRYEDSDNKMLSQFHQSDACGVMTEIMFELMS